MKDPIAKSLGGLVLQAARLHRLRTSQLLKSLGLFPGQERVLQALLDEKGLTMGDLATLLQVRPPTISKTVGRLAQQGLLERRGSEHDARVVRVSLTEIGRDRASRIGDIWARMEQEMTEDLDAKDRRRLRKALRRISRNLSEAIGGVEALLDAEEVEEF